MTFKSVISKKPFQEQNWRRKKDSLTDDKKEWKYALRGKKDKGDKDLRIIIMFDDPSAIIVTAIDKNKKED